MQQCTSLLLDLFPRNSFYLAGLNVMQTAHDLLLPSGVNILINGCVQAGDQISSQFGARSFSERAKAFCSNSWASWVISRIISLAATWIERAPSVVSIKRDSCRSGVTMGNGGLLPYVYLAADWICK